MFYCGLTKHIKLWAHVQVLVIICITPTPSDAQLLQKLLKLIKKISLLFIDICIAIKWTDIGQNHNYWHRKSLLDSKQLNYNQNWTIQSEKRWVLDSYTQGDLASVSGYAFDHLKCTLKWQFQSFCH